MNSKGEQITLSQLILARLLARGKQGERPGSIREGIQSVAGKANDKASLLADVRSQLIKLEQKGLIEKSSSRGSVYTLTSKGKQEAAAFLGLERVPDKERWETVRDTYLVAKALGVEPTYLKKHRLDGLRAVTLARLFNLPWRQSSTLTSVLDAYLARQFELRTQPRYSLRSAIVSKMFVSEKESPKGPTKRTFDVEQFARDVLSVASHCQTGWFGDEKVFISHVWLSYSQRPESLIGTLDAFKGHLIEAHRADLLTLAGADLVEAMNPEDVARSEARYLSATFHFIRCRRNG